MASILRGFIAAYSILQCAGSCGRSIGLKVSRRRDCRPRRGTIPSHGRRLLEATIAAEMAEARHKGLR